MKKKTLSKLKKDLWELCKKIIRSWYEPICYTCGRYITSLQDLQTGHGKAKSILPLKYQYDLRNLKIQCAKCNCYNGGMTDIFITKLEKEKEGLEFLKEACIKTKNGWEVKRSETMSSVEAYNFIKNKIEYYKNLIK